MSRDDAREGQSDRQYPDGPPLAPPVNEAEFARHLLESLERPFDDARRPFWHPDRFDFAARQLRFVRMDRDAFRRSTFLDHRTVRPDDRSVTMELDVLAQMARTLNGHAATVHFIFHHAFCGSTLLTRCLDQVAACLPLREPFVLHQLATQPEGVVNAFLPITVGLLSRPFAAKQVSVIKPSDYLSARMLDLLAARAGAKAVFLHTDLPDFVAQILKLEDRRSWIRTRLHPDFRRFAASLGVRTSGLSDGEAAAAAWFAQRYNYFLNCERPGGTNLRSLDFRQLLRDPLGVIEELARWFAIPLSPEDLAALPGIMTRNAKKPTAQYGYDAYLRDVTSILDRHPEELSGALLYVERLSVRAPMPVCLPRPLVCPRADDHRTGFASLRA